MKNLQYITEILEDNNVQWDSIHLVDWMIRKQISKSNEKP